jgi:hypothetical protein
MNRCISAPIYFLCVEPEEPERSSCLCDFVVNSADVHHRDSEAQRDFNIISDNFRADACLVFLIWIFKRMIS